MPLLLVALPALVAPAQTPTVPQTMDLLQEQLEAIPEAFIKGKSSAMPGLVAQADESWNRAKPALAKTVPTAEATAIDRQLQSMKKMKPREQAVGALGVSSLLSQFQPRSRQQDQLQADRTTMMAWCVVDSGELTRLPGVETAFKPLIDKDNGQHTVAVLAVQDALKRLQASQQKRQAAGMKKALRDLLDLLDVLEKP